MVILRELKSVNINSADKKKKEEFVNLFSTTINLETTMCQLAVNDIDDIKTIINSVLLDNKNKPCDIEEKARICYSFLNFSDLKNTRQFIEASLKIYSSSAGLYNLLASVTAFMKDYE